jgi:hypothetical protein
MPRRLLSLAVVVIAAASAGLAGTAHAGPVRGTPYTVTFPRGDVAQPIRTAVATGLSQMQTYEQRHLGVQAHGATEVRLVPGSRCDDGIPYRGESVGGVASGHLICLFSGVEAFPATASGRAYVAAHEAVHVLTYELGCNSRAPYWFLEGMAEVLSWRATVLRGEGESHLRTVSEIWAAQEGLSRGGLRPYEATERGLHYAEAGRAVAEADGGSPKRLVAFCRAVGAGTRWPVAFQRTFGVDINTFYTRFSKIRARILDTEVPSEY